MRVQITFRSGAQIEFDTLSIKTVRHPVTEVLTSIAWETPDDYNDKLFLMPCDLADIMAIIVRKGPPGTKDVVETTVVK